MKKSIIFTVLAGLSVSGLAFAQSVNYGPVQRASFSGGEESSNPSPYAPVLREDGSFVFPYGPALHTIICAPLHLCDVALQPGESVQQLEVGDTLRWQVKLSSSIQDGKDVAHLIIKPTMVGISSNLVAITDKRTYNLRLISKQDRSWIPKVAFSYPDEEMKASWAAYFAEQKSRQSSNLIGNAMNGGTLDFRYKLKGSKPVWRPTQIYSDHEKTYIHLPPAAQNSEIPVLLIEGPGSTDQLVNYRLDGDRFIVDTVIHRATLISGVGRHQERVEIVREGY